MIGLDEKVVNVSDSVIIMSDHVNYGTIDLVEDI